MNFKKYLNEYSKKELELIGFKDTPFESALLDFLDQCADISNEDPIVMKQVLSNVIRLIEHKPLSPITEEDFEVVSQSEDGSNEMLHCTKYPHIYKLNGKYYNNRAVAFCYLGQTEKMYRYGSNGSQKEIQLPYYVTEEIKIIDPETKEILF